MTLDNVSNGNPIFKYTPYLFTENGVAMLSSVLKSKQANQIHPKLPENRKKIGLKK